MRLLLLLLLTLNLLSAKKVALLIGNQDYDKANLQLNNPINDIEAIEETLEGIGFEVQLLKDASKREIEDELDDFYTRANSAEIALVYFSGHGLQVFDVDTDRVVNYLLPIEANVQRLRDLKNLIRLDRVVTDSSSAKKSIVLIDACRDNPLYGEIANIFRKHGTKSTSVSKGLGQIDFKTNDVLIAFATTSNSTANDGKGDLSPYAKALSRNLQKSGDISLVLRDVRDDVLVSTNNEQEPVIVKNTLSGMVCLSGDCNSINRKFYLFVDTTPKDATVKIMNIVEKYHNRISLERGIYDIQVEKHGYETERLKIVLDEDKILNVELEKPLSEKTIRNYWIVSISILLMFLIYIFFNFLKITHKKVKEINTIKGITIIDGLMYQNQPFTKEYTWEEAKEYAKNLRLGGYDDWRLPSKNELKKLLTKKKIKGKNGEYYIRKEFVDNIEIYPWFWTSEERDSSSAWCVRFYDGDDLWGNKTRSSYALCVR